MQEFNWSSAVTSPPPCPHLSVRCSDVQRGLRSRAPGIPDPPTGSPVTPTPAGRGRLETSRRFEGGRFCGGETATFPAAAGRETP
ncbi:hypothetical protein Q5P01_025630 [Channa striata]|uniref:Uncharacterized protein n=1 Tax=Channa striata TaxID=64152 RepID=A0AA88LIC4_CHASR|nr:hypothetical protein Q5P01_025630 [Channa striata]